MAIVIKYFFGGRFWYKILLPDLHYALWKKDPSGARTRACVCFVCELPEP